MRSNAWIRLFSSKLNTAALCGGSRYSPTTSRNFSSNRGSLLSLKVRTKCGFSPWARHTRLTKLWVVLRCRAIDRHDQWVASLGMRREEVLTLRWEWVDMNSFTFRVEETKTGIPLELPITRQLAEILKRRRAAAAELSDGVRDWVFPSLTSATGHVQDPHHLYGRISETGGAKFWFHGLRNSFITVAERELMLPPSLTKRLVNHARPNDVTQGYAADWTIAQLREPAQKIADRIEALMNDPTTGAVAA